jgi:hypothetical protein
MTAAAGYYYGAGSTVDAFKEDIPIIEKYVGPIVAYRVIIIGDIDTALSATPGVNIIGQYKKNSWFLYKKSPEWRNAGFYANKFAGPGITVNAAVYHQVVIPYKADILFRHNETGRLYHSAFSRFSNNSNEIAQDFNGELVRVASWREFERWSLDDVNTRGRRVGTPKGASSITVTAEEEADWIVKMRMLVRA